MFWRGRTVVQTESAAEGTGRTVLRKATVRLIPFLFVLYIVSFLDRVNVSFAALQMSEGLDRQDNDHLGHHLHRYVPSHRARKLLLAQVPARGGGGGVLPRNYSLPNLLVPGPRAGEGRRALHDRRRNSRCYRRAALRGATLPRRGSLWALRLAIPVHRRGFPGDPPRARGACLPARSPLRGPVAHRRGEALARGLPLARGAAQDDAWHAHIAPGLRGRKTLASLRRVLRYRHESLWDLVLAADDHRGVL